MKKFTTILTLFIVTSVAFTACGSSKKMTKAIKSDKVETPMSKSKFRTDKNYYRAVQSGTSADLSAAKKIALLNAKGDIASQIASTMKVVSENYTNQLNVEDVSEFATTFDENIRSVTNQELTDVKIVSEETYKKKKSSVWTVWVCIEVSKAAVADKVTDRISQDDRTRVQFNKDEFMQVFNTEMEKYEY